MVVTILRVMYAGRDIDNQLNMKTNRGKVVDFVYYQ